MRIPFDGRASAAAVLFIGLSWLAACALVFSGGQAPTPDKETLLWVLAVLAFLPAGVVASAIARSLAVRELFVATLTVTAATLLYGRFGITVNPFAAVSSRPELDVVRIMAGAPGSSYLGTFWAREVAAIAAFGFVQALTVSSLAFMFRAATGFELWAGLEAWMAARYLSAKRRDARVSATAIIAAVGVAIGVTALIVVTSTMSGYQAEVKEKLLSTNAHLIVQRVGRELENPDRVIAEIATVPGVVASTPFVFTGGMLAVENPEDIHIDPSIAGAARGNYPVLVKGIDPDRVGMVTAVREQLQDIDIGVLRPAKPGDLPKVIVGKELMKKLGARSGAILALTSPVESEGKRGGPPKRMRFRLAGEFSSGMNEFDQRLVYMGIDASQRYIGSENAVTGIEVKTKNPDTVAALGEKIRMKLGGWPYRVIDYEQMNSGIFSALKMQKALMVLTIAFLIIVAAFNIASTLFMLVVEKTREIAVLKAMGGKDGMIMKIFVIEGHLIGTAGVAAGVIFGLFLCKALGYLRIHIAADVYLVDTLRVLVNPTEVGLIVLGALEIAHLATLYPALRASRTAPVEAMRYG